MDTDNKTNLLMDETSVLLQKNSPDEDFQFNFETRPAPATRPERNDNYCPKIYHTGKHNFEIVIKPLNTPFWRFGFRYSKTEVFPPDTEARHNDKNIVDIHICVGDMRPNRKWHNANKVYLQSYHVPHKPNPQIVEVNYKGEEITLIAKWNERTSQVHYELVSNRRILYQYEFKLEGFNFCMFGGWSDFNEYNLSTDIKVSSSQ